jgi:metal-dependent amidase/aminoacylase/carboxypeptidase family protein
MASLTETVSSILPDLKPYEDLYKHFHSHPELSFQEHETAARIHEHLKSLGINGERELHQGVGGTGVVAVVKNGPGQIVLLRADIDALPVEEKTGLEYKSTKRVTNRDGEEKPAMHVISYPNPFYIKSCPDVAMRSIANLLAETNVLTQV